MTVIQSNTILPGGCVPPPQTDPANPSNASTKMEGGLVKFENDNYRITAGDNNEVTIFNKKTGESYRAWGDPHMEVDGKAAFDFWGTTTLALDDGTKVTIETTPWANNPEMTLSSKVTITNGDYGVQITGVDTNKMGDLKFEEGKGWGKLIDAVVADGNTLYENSCGKGFVGIDGKGQLRQVDQTFINETDLKKGGALQEKFKEAFNQLSSLVSISFLGAFLGSLPGGGETGKCDGGHAPQPSPFPPVHLPHFPGHHHHHFHGHCVPHIGVEAQVQASFQLTLNRSTRNA